MIAAMAPRLLRLIFSRLLDSLTLLSRVGFQNSANASDLRFTPQVRTR
jgi:hypothetical protein